MDKDPRDLEMEEFLKNVKLKEPSERELSDFLSGVHTKIDRGVGRPSIGVPQVAFVIAICLATIGAVYVLVFGVQKQPVRVGEAVMFSADRGPAPGPVEHLTGAPAQASGAIQTADQELTIEEEQVIFDELASDPEDETIDLLDASELLDELALLDDLEFAGLSAPQAPSGV